jgi:pimeloyl-ACP methyl ester carboxylesterase
MSSLYIEETGAGDPVVLLHSHGLSGSQWRKLTPDLVARGFRVLAVDFTGHGRSAPWPEPKPFSFTIDVERVGDIIRRVQPAHLVGHSYGGLVALHVARALPGSVRTLALFDPVAFHVLDADEDRDARAMLAALDLSWQPGPEQRDRWLRTFVDFWGGVGAWSTLREDVRDEFRRVAWVIREGVRTLAEDQTPLAAFGGLRVPTLLMTGEHSPLPARSVVNQLAKVMTDAGHEVIPAAGHLGPVTHAADVNSRIIAELTASSATGRP